ncbi:MAG: DUF4339 domain-containing protein, partial [Flavobacteriales bacterium]|nr:DUF4339 domain-containing protein [Flavobacteriales bacterium]
EFTKQTHVWKQGMENWQEAGNVQELSPLFSSGMPPPLLLLHLQPDRISE